MYGCNNFCPYCIVPYVRGRERSRKPSSILAEIKELAKDGYKEVTLLGQNVNSYQGDGENGIYNFADLLRSIQEIDGIEVFHFISPHPKDFTDEVIQAIHDCPKVSRILHLPLQSGSSRVLKLMNRKYTKEQYLQLVKKIRAKIPDIVFSTDIIVGFPNETEEDFEDTLNYCKQIGFAKIHVFPYSDRNGTVASRMRDHVPRTIVKERARKLIELSDSLEKEYFKKFINTEEEVLVEEFKNDYYHGFTENYIPVKLKEATPNKIVKVKLTKENINYNLED